MRKDCVIAQFACVTVNEEMQKIKGLNAPFAKKQGEIHTNFVGIAISRGLKITYVTKTKSIEFLQHVVLQLWDTVELKEYHWSGFAQNVVPY